MQDRCHPVLQATLSHDFSQRTKRAEKRRSLDERVLRSGIDLSTYSAEEREILAMVIKNEATEPSCSDASALSRLAAARTSSRAGRTSPTGFVREGRRSRKIFTRQSSVKSHPKESQDSETDTTVFPKRATVFKRFVQSASAKLAKTSYKTPVVLRDCSVDSPRAKQRRYNLVSKTSDSCQPKTRRPSGNLELHAMLHEEFKKTASEHCLSSSALNIPEKIEKARTEYSDKHTGVDRRASSPNAKKRSEGHNAGHRRSMSSGSQQPSEETEKIFHVFGQFKNDPFHDSC